MADEKQQNNTGEAGAPTQGETAATGKTFTEADMASARRSWESRAAKEADKRASAAVAAFVTELGFESSDEMRAAIESTRANGDAASQAAQELKKLQRQLAQTTKDAETFKQQYTALQQERNASKLRAAVYEAAGKIGAYEDEVFAVLSVGDRVGIDEDGNVVVKKDGKPVDGVNVESVIKDLVAERQHLARPVPGQGAGSRPAPTNGASQRPELLSRDGITSALERLHREGRLVR